VDLRFLFKDVAGNYVELCTTPMQMRHLSIVPCALHLAERYVTCLIVPNDVQGIRDRAATACAWHDPLKYRLFVTARNPVRGRSLACGKRA
jgi:hypothetical protein